MSSTDVVKAELFARLLAHAPWHPSRYEGTCVLCDEQVHRNEPITLVNTARGPRWVCTCIFMPGATLDQKLGALRLCNH